MARILIRHPGVKREPKDLGPANGHPQRWDVLRRPIDIALTEAPRHVDVNLWQPNRP